LAAAAADTYFDAGFTVVFEDVIAPQSLGALEESIRGRPRHVIVLLPSLIALAAREAERAYKGYGSWTIAELHAAFAGAPERIGLWLDSSELTAQETADRILQATSSAGAA
jgi:hypothetical protein